MGALILPKRFKPVLLTDLLAPDLDLRVAWSRAGAKSYFDSTGTLQSAANNTNPLEYEPNTLMPLGRSIWDTRTNSVRNSLGTGAIVPNSLPTYWVKATNFQGLNFAVVQSVTEKGVACTDVRIYGTPTASSNVYISGEAGSGIAAANGQTWTGSAFLKLAGGSLTNVSSVVMTQYEFDSAQASLGSASQTVALNGTLTRYQCTRVMVNATCAYTQSRVAINFTNGLPIDITLRIGLPQVEQGSSASNPIPTSSATVTRPADVPTISGSPLSVFNPLEGTLYAEGVFDAMNSKMRVFAQFDDGTSANIIQNRTNSAGNAYAATVTKGGVQGLNNAYGTVAANVVLKNAVAYKSGNSNAAGGGILTAQSGNAFVDFAGIINRLALGQSASPTNMLNGWLRRVAYYNRRLPDAYLAALTK